MFSIEALTAVTHYVNASWNRPIIFSVLPADRGSCIMEFQSEAMSAPYFIGSYITGDVLTSAGRVMLAYSFDEVLDMIKQKAVDHANNLL